MSYLCKWSDGENKYLEWQRMEEVPLSFFYVPSNNYSEQDRFMIEKLARGDRLDLSDGLGQWHEIERVK
jgi:hypothetical protein